MGHQIGAGTLAADLERIAAASSDPASWRPDPARLAALLEECSEPVLLERWRSVLEAVNQHWDRLLSPGAAPALRSPPVWGLRLARQRERLVRAAGRLGF
jgi:hypothetical protein